MLVIPVMGSAGSRNRPILTIALIAINCIAFFLFQFNDGERQAQAMQYYFSSGLEKIELTAYIEYLRNGRQGMASLPDVEKMDGQLHGRFLTRMIQDEAFQTKLAGGEIITPENKHYASWKPLREAFNKMLGATTTWQFGFRPADHRPVTFLTHMFLHGGFMHLLGNMVFLWFVGCVLELGCGRLWFPAIYIPGGLAAVGLFWAIYPASTVPLVGASGAIAALMGAFAVLYGSKKIKVFYSLGFYFGYRQVYGFTLLPVWLCNEFYQLFWGGMSNVAYVAHIGGLVGGALLGFACRFTHGAEAAEELFREKPPDEITPLFETALEKMGALDLPGARSLLEQVLAKDPNHTKALQQLYALERHEPQNPRFHRAAERLLGQLCGKKETQAKVCELYADYRAAARPQRLSDALYVKVGMAHIHSGRPEAAEKIFSVLLRHRPEADGLPQALLKLAEGFRKKQLPERATACLKALGAKFPTSPAARIAATALAAQKPEGPQR